MRRINKFIALGLMATMVVSSMTGCGEIVSAKEENSENVVDGIEEIESLIQHSDSAGKEETVYVIMDADGNKKETIVSEWLKNANGDKELKDVSNLQNIDVVKGDVDFSADGENITFNTNGSDVYYKGTSTKELPVDVTISYELDGRKVSADELKGANGHLKITFDYTNNTGVDKVIDGENVTIYQPFVMASGLVLDNKNAKNVTVENGSVINSGDNTVAFGLAMPGLAESLGIKDLKDDNGELIEVKIPENVVVEADVTDFSLMMTITVASNNALSELGLSDIDSLDDLKADMNKLTDGMNDIVDGATRLTDGVYKLSDGTGSLSSGVEELSNGAGSLADGAHKVADGANQVNEGAVALNNGLNSLKENAPALTSGINELSAGAGQLTSGVNQVIENNESLNNGAAAVASGLDTLNSALNDENVAAQLQALVAGSQSVAGGISNAATGANALAEGSNPENLAAAIGALTQMQQGFAAASEATAAQGDTEMATQYATYAATLSAVIEGVNTYSYGVNEGAKNLSAGLDTLNAGYTQVDAGITSVVSKMDEIKSGVGQLSAGANQVAGGVSSYTQAVSAVAAGASSLNDGLNTLNLKVPTLVSGIDQLSAGAGKLAVGTSSLTDGASSLADGADKLNNGTSTLKDGVSTLVSGVSELADGSSTLKDGVIKYNDEGIKKLADVINNDLEKYYHRLQAVRDLSEEYNSYGGCADGVECSVKFIYKTESIN